MGETLNILRRHAQAAAAHAHVPYSGRREAAVLLLADGTWVPGVRVESASFSLTIPCLVNAVTTAVAANRADLVAVVLSRPARQEEATYLRALPHGPFRQTAADVFLSDAPASLPEIDERLVPFLDKPVPEDSTAGVALARQVAQRAYAPESAFPVGCVLVTADGRLIPGVNVEHDDWSRILCAERNALGTALSWGLTRFRTLYLTCLNDPAGSPCGACRQLLAEHAPEATLWIDRGATSPEETSSEILLPGAFRGRGLGYLA